MELMIVRKLIDLLNKEITYCHWKSNQHFQNALSGIDDLDILVDREQHNKIVKHITELGFKHFYTPELRTYVGIEDYLGFDSETGIIVHLHLHYMLMIGEKHLKGFRFPIEHYVLERRIWSEEYKVYFSNPEDELLLLIIRRGLKARKRDFIFNKFEQKMSEEYTWLKKQCDSFENYIHTCKWLDKDLQELILDVYFHGFSPSRNMKIKHKIEFNYACLSKSGFIGNEFQRHVNELFRIKTEIIKRCFKGTNLFLRRRSSNGGFLIALVGSDGAGKSSAIKEISKWLCKVMDVRTYYLGAGDGKSSIIMKLLKLLKAIAQKTGIIHKSGNVSINNESTEKTNTLYFKLWTYFLSKERKHKLVKANRNRNHGYIVLCDRFPQNEMVGLCDGRKLSDQNNIAAKAESQAFHIASLCAPDLVIKLVVSPEVAKNRKPDEIDIETSSVLTDRILALKYSDTTKIKVINGDQDQNKVLLEIKQTIWNIL